MTDAASFILRPMTTERWVQNFPSGLIEGQCLICGRTERFPFTGRGDLVLPDSLHCTGVTGEQILRHALHE